MSFMSMSILSLMGAFLYTAMSLFEAIIFTREFKELKEYGKSFLRALVVSAFVLYMSMEAEADVITVGPVPF